MNTNDFNNCIEAFNKIDKPDIRLEVLKKMQSEYIAAKEYFEKNKKIFSLKDVEGRFPLYYHPHQKKIILKYPIYEICLTGEYIDKKYGFVHSLALNNDVVEYLTRKIKECKVMIGKDDDDFEKWCILICCWVDRLEDNKRIIEGVEKKIRFIDKNLERIKKKLKGENIKCSLEPYRVDISKIQTKIWYATRTWSVETDKNGRVIAIEQNGKWENLQD